MLNQVQYVNNALSLAALAQLGMVQIQYALYDCAHGPTCTRKFLFSESVALSAAAAAAAVAELGYNLHIRVKVPENSLLKSTGVTFHHGLYG